MTLPTILIAEDNPEILELTTLTLESAGYRVIQAENGRAALDLFHQHWAEIRLVVLDLVMPELSGQEVAKEIRHFDKSTRILFVSGFVPDDTSTEQTGPILRKPYRASALLRRVEELLDD